MHAFMISYLLLLFWQDQYDASQARVIALECQLAALQVEDDNDEHEASNGEEVAGEEEHADDDHIEDPTTNLADEGATIEEMRSDRI